MVAAEYGIIGDKKERMKKEEEQGLYDDLPMPKIAAIVGWLTCCIVCLGVLLAGKALVGVFTDWSIKIRISDIVIALVVGTIFHFKNRKGRQKKGKP